MQSLILKCFLVFGFAVSPWKIEASAARFLAFLNGYSIFLGPITGVLFCDFCVVRKASGYHVQQLYSTHSIYWYSSGVNLRAMAAFITDMVPQLPGLMYKINPNLGGISSGYIKFTSMAWVNAGFFSD